MAAVVIALGSNVGDRIGNLRHALVKLERILSDLRVSSVYSSAPMYIHDQDTFFNAAATGKTSLGPWPLLQLLKSIEQQLGRVSRQRNGPREIDLDLIAYGSIRYRFSESDVEHLEVPHPRLQERRFVLLPLNEIVPNLHLPGLASVGELLAATKEQAGDVSLQRHEVLSIHG